MKCSLLTLSTFIDDELPPARRAEVDAHLVGCSRCRAGATTLREERIRVGRLARAHVDPESARVMLEQVGIAVELSGAARPMRPPIGADREPLSRASADATAIPLIPPRPPSTPAAIEEMTVPDVSPELQPDLPFAGTLTEERWDDEAPLSEADPSAAAEPALAPVDDLDDLGTDPALMDSWEADLPPPIEALDGGDPWTAAPPPVALSAPPPVQAAPVLPPTPAPPPTRLPDAPWGSALWSRARDAVAVRLALARGRRDLEDSVEAIGDAHRGRGSAPPPPPPAGMPAADVVDDALTADAGSPSAIELSGTRGTTIPARAGAIRELDERAAAARSTDAGVSARGAGKAPDVVRPAAEGWHAFAASSYPVDAEATDFRANGARRPLGRHGRAVARQSSGALARASGAIVAAGTGLRDAVATGVGGARSRARTSPRLSRLGPDSFVLAGVAVIGLVFVLALLIGRISSPAHPATAARAASSSSGTGTTPLHSNPARTSAPSAAPTAAASAAASSTPSRAPTRAPVLAPPAAQTFGTGATGFQALGLRFGQQPTYMRVVFDLGPVSGTVSGTPRVTVSFSDLTTMLVTLIGAAPAPSITTPAGTVISSITLVSGSAERTQYRFALRRPATVKAFFLGSPTRFVLDLH